MSGKLAVPADATGLRLYKHVGDQLVGCELMLFPGGAAAVDMVLRRAAISGRVEVGGDIEDFFADIYDGDHSITETVALDRHSYRALKNRWMRCKIEKEPGP